MLEASPLDHPLRRDDATQPMCSEAFAVFFFFLVGHDTARREKGKKRNPCALHCLALPCDVHTQVLIPQLNGLYLKLRDEKVA